MRWFLFTGDDADFDFFESCGFEPMMQIAFRETQPAVAVKLVGLVKIVLEQVEDQNLPAGFQNPVRGGEGIRRDFGMVKSLA